MFKWDRFTIKAQEAIQRAQEIAGQRNHQEITPAHLFLALIEDREGIAGSLLKALGMSISALNIFCWDYVRMRPLPWVRFCRDRV